MSEDRVSLRGVGIAAIVVCLAAFGCSRAVEPDTAGEVEAAPRRMRIEPGPELDADVLRQFEMIDSISPREMLEDLRRNHLPHCPEREADLRMIEELSRDGK